ncbi:hypothetical protein [Amycolatopsis sp. WAC 01416]|uniref:hypothetical protein n=1 Tax=Amycolatopsis sp. WAC 01416 TaxID=2203196 RepID=UPI000F77F304|nr:hypothetical protein [Amycolatopsis sp. WAC 01416]
MINPFQLKKQSLIENNMDLVAPPKVVESWKDLANKVWQELVDIGFSASVIAEGDEFPSTAGVVVRIHKQDPYGVTLEWHAPVVDSEQYQREVLEQVHKPAVTSRLIRHVSEAKEIATKAAFDVLKDAGFQTMMDYIERGGYYYRVLSTPADQ